MVDRIEAPQLMKRVDDDDSGEQVVEEGALPETEGSTGAPVYII